MPELREFSIEKGKFLSELNSSSIYVPIGRKHRMLIDLEDLELFNKFPWKIVKANSSLAYVIRSTDRVRFHRVVSNATVGQIVDHINGNGLDNRKCNLRFVTHQENILNGRLSKNNKSGVRGVFFCPKKNKWRAFLNIKETHYSKMVNTKEEAIEYRLQLEKQYVTISLEASKQRKTSDPQ